MGLRCGRETRNDPVNVLRYSDLRSGCAASLAMPRPYGGLRRFGFAETSQSRRGRPNGQIVLSEPVSASEGSRGRPRGKLQLAEDVGDMAVDGVLAENQALRDVAVGETLGDQAENL
jgi:hypothetical protein